MFILKHISTDADVKFYVKLIYKAYEETWEIRKKIWLAETAQRKT